MCSLKGTSKDSCVVENGNFKCRDKAKNYYIVFHLAAIDDHEWPFNWATTKCIADAFSLHC